MQDLQDDPDDQRQIDTLVATWFLEGVLHGVSRIVIFHNVSSNWDVTKWCVHMNMEISIDSPNGTTILLFGCRIYRNP